MRQNWSASLSFLGNPLSCRAGICVLFRIIAIEQTLIFLPFIFTVRLSCNAHSSSFAVFSLSGRVYCFGDTLCHVLRIGTGCSIVHPHHSL